MADKVFLAIDLGASSGRQVAGIYADDILKLEEVHRFENGPVFVADSAFWDVLRLWQEIQNGFRVAAEKYRDRIASVGVDTWGVDFGLLGEGDLLLGNPYHYRDSRTDGILEQADAVCPRSEIFRCTGLQFLQFNTLYQLWAMEQAGSPILRHAKEFLMMPDLFHWMMTGEKANEFTNATTTQLFDPSQKRWSDELCQRFGLPREILGEIVSPGTSLGKLRNRVARDVGGLSNIEVIAPATHDTASAVMAVPAVGEIGSRPNWCYISSGTWSLMGVEMPVPVVNEECLRLNFTNEGGVAGTTRLLKNISGLWLVQECRRIWNLAGHQYEWEDLDRMAEEATQLSVLIDPDDTAFLAPDDMPRAIVDYSRRTNQSPPSQHGAIIRCALESLALKYRQVLSSLESLIGGRLETIHIVGGGAQNRRLSQMAADACNRRVVAGPVEATAIGNVLVQSITAGLVGGISEAREVVRRSFSLEEFEPQSTAIWDDAYEKFVRLGKASRPS